MKHIGYNMDEKSETWYPHLLGFLLPIITILGIYKGGYWAFSGFVYAIFLGPILDVLSPKTAPTRSGPKPFIWNSLLVSHAIFMYASIVILCWRAKVDDFGIPVIMGALSVGVVSGISGIINAHEAGHRKKGSYLWRLSRINLFLVLYEHFTTEHNNSHHRNYATVKDAASAPRGVGLWGHLIRTIPLQYISAWKTHSGKGRTGFKNPILHGLIIQLGMLIALLLYSPSAMYAFLIQAGIAIFLLEFVNYLQHYGLRREIRERHTVMHSWEFRGVWSRWTLLELPLHPAHHLKASKPLWDLRAQEGSPQLPFGYYVCLWVAIFPPLWKKVMGRRIDSLTPA